jgi:hypothetical protein
MMAEPPFLKGKRGSPFMSLGEDLDAWRDLLAFLDEAAKAYGS